MVDERGHQLNFIEPRFCGRDLEKLSGQILSASCVEISAPRSQALRGAELFLSRRCLGASFSLNSASVIDTWKNLANEF